MTESPNPREMFPVAYTDGGEEKGLSLLEGVPCASILMVASMMARNDMINKFLFISCGMNISRNI